MRFNKAMEYALKKLKNGVRLLEVPVADARSVTVLILFAVGSRFEDRNINGLSHFLEHMFFKGTKNRPTAQSISEEVDSVGGEMNAFTSKEYTGYYIKAATQHGDLAVDVLSDMLNNSLFDQAEIDRERGVILEEVKMYEDQPMLFVGEIFEAKMFGDTPLGWQVIGLPKNISRVNREDFLNYKNRFYSADNMLVVLAGGTKSLNKSVEQKFGEFKSYKSNRALKGTYNTEGKPYEVLVKKTEQTHLWVGFRGLAASDPDRFALRVISAILGGGMSSRLFLSVRERKGLAYYVRSNVELYTDTGYIAASAGVATEKLQDAMEAILLELKTIRDVKVEAKELNKAKEYLKGKMLLQVEQSDNLAELLGMQEILGQPILTPEEINKRISAVTADDVMRVAKKLFTQEHLRAAVISSKDPSDWLEKHLKV